MPAEHCACLRTPAAAQLGLSRPMFLRAAPGHSTAKLLLQRCRSLPPKKRLVCPVAPRTAACRAISRARCRCVCHCLFPPAPPFSALQPCARVTCVHIAGAAGWPWRAAATLGSVWPATKVCDSHRKLLVGIFIVVTAVQANAFLARQPLFPNALRWLNCLCPCRHRQLLPLASLLPAQQSAVDDCVVIPRKKCFIFLASLCVGRHSWRCAHVFRVR